MPGTALVLIVSYLMAKSTPWEMQRSVQPVSKKRNNTATFPPCLRLGRLGFASAVQQLPVLIAAYHQRNADWSFAQWDNGATLT
jgi:hypothetical protein